jgi:hypothetical protein
MSEIPRPTKEDFKAMNHWTVLQRLVADAWETHRAAFKDELARRMADGRITPAMLDGFNGGSHTYQGPPQASPSPATPPWQSSSQQPITLNLSTSLHELASKMIASGWRCEGMRAPEQAYDWLTLATQRDEYMQDIPAEGQDFWKAALTKWQLWQIRRARGATD